MEGSAQPNAPGWMGPRAGLEAVAKRKQIPPVPWREFKPGHPTRRLVTILTELSRLGGTEKDYESQDIRSQEKYHQVVKGD